MREGWIYSLAPVLLIIALAAAAYLLTRNWSHPATYFPLVWSLQTLPLLVLAPDVEIHPIGLWWIALASFSVQCGVMTAGIRPSRNRSLSRRALQVHLRLNAMPLLTKTVAAILPAGLCYCFFVILEPQRTIGNLLSLNSIAQMATANTAFRYSNEYVKPGLLLQLLSTATYIGPALGGIMFALRRSRRDSLIAFATLLPPLVAALTQTTKAAFLFGGAFWVANYVACSVYVPRRTGSLKPIFAGLFAILLLLGLIGTTETLRRGTVPTLYSIRDSIASDRAGTMMYGHLVAFSEWFRQYLKEPAEPTLGVYTFAGPAELLGIKERELGIYSDFVVIGGSATNVYTSFRGLIQDFTVPGALILLFLLGVMGGRAHRMAIAGNSAAMPLLATFYIFSHWYLGSIFAYNSTIFALVCTAIYWRVVTGPRLSKPNISKVPLCRKYSLSA